MRSKILMISNVLILIIGTNCSDNDKDISDDELIHLLLSDIKDCGDVSSFAKMSFNGLYINLEEFDDLNYDCIYPLIRGRYFDKVSSLQVKYNIDKKDIGYFIIGLIHNSLNELNTNTDDLKLAAKELKCQDYVAYMRREISKADDYIFKARSSSAIVGDKLELGFLVEKNNPRDTAVICFYDMIYNKDVPEKYYIFNVRGIVDEVFVDIVENYPIYYYLKSIKWIKST